MKPIISASILSADFANLGAECQAVLQAGADVIHFDVMDHHFVPNLSFGAVVCKALRNAGIKAPIDVHLMVDNPNAYIEPFAKAGATYLTFHPETVNNVQATIDQIKKAGMQPGLAFNPEKAIDITDDLLQQLILVLVMSVNPGFGGQAFMPEVLPKVKAIRQRIDALPCETWVAIDGGIKVDNVKIVTQAGADFLVMGSGLFNTDDYALCINEVRASLGGDE